MLRQNHIMQRKGYIGQKNQKGINFKKKYENRVKQKKITEMGCGGGVVTATGRGVAVAYPSPLTRT